MLGNHRQGLFRRRVYSWGFHRSIPGVVGSMLLGNSLMSNQTSDPLVLPDTLIKWRSSGHDVKGKIPRDIWTPLEPYFQTLGYTLWTPCWSINLIPPNLNERAPDGFGYRTFMNDVGSEWTFGHVVDFSHCRDSVLSH